MVRLGIDLGGTKTEIIALGIEREALLRRRVPTPRGDYDATVKTIAQLVENAESELGERGSIGIGTPGAISFANGRMKNANSTWLLGKPLRSDLEAALGRNIRMTNDANTFALSEATDGAAANARVVFAVILGTGVGGGIAVDRRVHDGANAIAGEWGHVALPWPKPDELPGPACYCGKFGCIETFLSGPALERDGSIERYEDRLARGLSMIVNMLDPDAIVLGGGVSNIARLYENLPALMRAYVFSDTFSTPIVRATHGDSSGVRGAAMLWEE
jgi:predicted NBD/HSP70 family sugar kinase